MLTAACCAFAGAGCGLVAAVFCFGQISLRGAAACDAIGLLLISIAVVLDLRAMREEKR